MYSDEEYARSEKIARAEDALRTQRFLADVEVPDELISGRMTIEQAIKNDVQRRRALRLALRAG